MIAAVRRACFAIGEVIFDRTTPAGRRAVLDVRRNRFEPCLEREFGFTRPGDPPVPLVVVLDPKRTEPMTVRVRFAGTFAAMGAHTVSAASRTAAAVFRGARPATVYGSSSWLTDWVRFDVDLGDFDARGTGRYDVTWDWTCVDTRGNVATLGETCFRVFAVPAAPDPSQGPWSQPSLDRGRDVPWTDLLEWACDWAAGAQTTLEAAARITEQVFRLGSSGRTERGLARLHYDGGSSRFVCGARQEVFRLTKLLDLLKAAADEASVDPGLACRDCASLVTAAANALGANLVVRRIVPTTGVMFTCRPVELIGGARAARLRLREHQFACLDRERLVFDACAALCPRASTSTEFDLPVAMPLPTYLERLVEDPRTVAVEPVGPRSLDIPP